MTKTINTLTVFLSLVSMPIYKVGASDEMDPTNMEQMISAIKLEKMQMDTIVDKMVSRGRISEDEGSKVKREIASVKDEDIEEVRVKAIHELKSPNIANNK